MSNPGRFKLPAPPVEKGNIAKWIREELFPVLKSLRPMSGANWKVDKIGPNGWRGRAQAKSSPGSRTYTPWQPYAGGVEDNPLQIKIRTGALRGSGQSVIPSNANGLVTLTADSDNYVSLECTLVLGQLVSCAYVADTEIPSNPAPDPDTFPTTFYVLLFKLPATTAPSWGELEQYESTALTVVTQHIDTTGAPPDWTKHYTTICVR